VSCQTHGRAAPRRRRAAANPPSAEPPSEQPNCAGSFTERRDACDLLFRGLDLLGACCLLALFSPLMLAVAVLIKKTSVGPALFWQERVGRHGRVFWLVKFRTMRLDAERDTGPVWAVACDPRCTRLGGHLRRWCLDELPQLYNVLRGEMSLVGPRPERPIFVAQFEQRLAGYARRHAVLPGMTGWAQVHGWRGDSSLEARLEHDLYYVGHRGLALYLRVLLLTPYTLLFPRTCPGTHACPQRSLSESAPLCHEFPTAAAASVGDRPSLLELVR